MKSCKDALVDVHVYRNARVIEWRLYCLVKDTCTILLYQMTKQQTNPNAKFLQTT